MQLTDLLIILIVVIDICVNLYMWLKTKKALDKREESLCEREFRINEVVRTYGIDETIL